MLSLGSPICIKQQVNPAVVRGMSAAKKRQNNINENARHVLRKISLQTAWDKGEGLAEVGESKGPSLKVRKTLPQCH